MIIIIIVLNLQNERRKYIFQATDHRLVFWFFFFVIPVHHHHQSPPPKTPNDVVGTAAIRLPDSDTADFGPSETVTFIRRINWSRKFYVLTIVGLRFFRSSSVQFEWRSLYLIWNRYKKFLKLKFLKLNNWNMLNKIFYNVDKQQKIGKSISNDRSGNLCYFTDNSL